MYALESSCTIVLSFVVTATCCCWILKLKLATTYAGDPGLRKVLMRVTKLYLCLCVSIKNERGSWSEYTEMSQMNNGSKYDDVQEKEKE